MKLFIVLSVIAYGYAAKLDRTYLPPVSAANAGGSPGALTAPIHSGSNLQHGHSSSEVQPERLDYTQTNSGLVQGSSGNQPRINDFTSSNNVPSYSSGHIMPISHNSGFESGPSEDSELIPSQTGYRNDNTQLNDNLNQGFVQGSEQNVPQAYTPERSQASADRNAEILKYINENNIDSYNYSYETSNGISAEEAGEASNGVRAQGAYSYTGDDGEFYSITYTADENGYQPQGDHLPTPHPIPEEILKSIEINARAAAAGTQEGAYRPEEYESEISQQQYDGESSRFNQPQGESHGSVQGHRENHGQTINRQQENQYSTSQGPSGQRFINDQSGSSELFKGNTQPTFDNSEISKGHNQENNGYKYKQPQNVFGSSRLGQGSLDQNGQKQTSYSSSMSGSLSGNVPTLRTQTQYHDQSDIQSGNQPTEQVNSYNQGQIKQFETKQGSYQVPHSSHSSGVSQQLGSPGSSDQGYKYHSKANQNTFSPNFAVNQGSFSEDGISNGNQNQYKQSFDDRNGLGQHTLPTENHKTQISSQNDNQPIFKTNTQETRISGSNGSHDSQNTQAPYQYNQPDQQQNFGIESDGSTGKQGANQFGEPRQPHSFTPEEGYKY